MESLATISLVGNIIQFINLGTSLVSKSREIYQSTSGFDKENADLELVANDIRKVGAGLIAGATSSPELEQIIQACNEVSKELLDALAEVQTKSKERSSSGYQTKWHSLRKAWKSVWKQEYIAELQRRLDNLRNQMSMHMFCNAQKDRDQLHQDLIGLQKSHTRSDHVFSEKFDSLEAQLQNVQAKISTNDDRIWASLHDLLPSLMSEARKVSRIYAIIDSLLYGCMKVRHTAIKSAYAMTFEWIFNHESLPSEDPRSQICFSEWLEQDAGVFWVTGKPGSGKSTLMKWLYSHRATTEKLQKWAGDANLIKTEFYFWNPGDIMQKSLEGLLQTILYHILHARPDLVSLLCPRRWNSDFEDASNDLKAPWTLTELREALVEFQAHSLTDTKFYFQIDGLDEYSGDSYEVIDILGGLATSPNVKLCLSSRPWNAFEDAYGKYCNKHIIRLHELTRDDIELFACQNLKSYYTGTDFEAHQFEDLVRDIRARAQGVFLWVHLAVRSLRNGIINDDPLPLLQERLRAIPSDLEEFFEQILSSVESIYRPSMASTFLVALRANKPLRIIHYYFVEFGDDTSWYKETATSWTGEAVQKMVDRTQRRLNGRFKGLLEPTSARDVQYSTTVDFLHRTLRDFLKTGPVRTTLESWLQQETHVLLSVSRALVAEAKFIEDRPCANSLGASIEYASVASEESGTTNQYYEMLDQIDLVHKKAYPQSNECQLHKFMLRAASWVGDLEYVRYRLTRDKDNIDATLILEHLLKCQVNDKMTLAELIQSEFKHEIGCMQKKGLCPPSPAMVQYMVDLGAKPSTESGADSPLPSFFKQMIRLMDGKHSETIWNIFRSLLDANFIDPNSWPEVWAEVLTRKGLRSKLASLNTLRYFKSLFKRGLNPNIVAFSDTLFTKFLHIIPQGIVINSSHITEPFKENFDELLREFLRHGADMQPLCDKTGRSWLSSVWWRIGCHKEKPTTSWTSELLILLQHGLDPNQVFSNWRSSLWVSLLESFESSVAGPTQQQALQRCFVMCLNYGADPRADGVHEAMSWMEGEESELTDQEVAEIRAALEKEFLHTHSRENNIPKERWILSRANRGQPSRRPMRPYACLGSLGHNDSRSTKKTSRMYNLGRPYYSTIPLRIAEGSVTG